MAKSKLDYLREFAISSDPVLSAPEIAELVGVSQQGAYSRLQSLEADGYLDSKKVGAKARVFWLSDKGKAYVSEELMGSE